MHTSVRIITPPTSKAGLVPISNLVKIMKNFFSEVEVVSGGKIETVDQEGVVVKNLNRREDMNLASLMLFQLAATRESRNLNDLEVFYRGGHFLFLKSMVNKIRGQKQIILVSGAVGLSEKHAPMAMFYRLLSFISFSMADAIVVYSPGAVNEYKLERYNNKILIAGAHTIDRSIYNISKSYSSRSIEYSFIGRLNMEKGIEELIEGWKESPPDEPLHVFGEGEFKDLVLSTENVEYHGWVDHESMPFILNDIKFLIIPSRTEGLPNIMLEAMACGCVVIATRVGSIADVIIDGENGFLLPGNDVKAIVSFLQATKAQYDLNKISMNASRTVLDGYSPQAKLTRWGEIIQSLNLN